MGRGKWQTQSKQTWKWQTKCYHSEGMKLADKHLARLLLLLTQNRRTNLITGHRLIPILSSALRLLMERQPLSAMAFLWGDSRFSVSGSIRWCNKTSHGRRLLVSLRPIRCQTRLYWRTTLVLWRSRYWECRCLLGFAVRSKQRDRSSVDGGSQHDQRRFITDTQAPATCTVRTASVHGWISAPSATSVCVSATSAREQSRRAIVSCVLAVHHSCSPKFLCLFWSHSTGYSRLHDGRRPCKQRPQHTTTEEEVKTCWMRRVSRLASTSSTQERTMSPSVPQDCQPQSWCAHFVTTAPPLLTVTPTFLNRWWSTLPRRDRMSHFWLYQFDFSYIRLPIGWLSIVTFALGRTV